MKSVLITGGNTGIGLATSELFIEKGWHVIILYLKGSINDVNKLGCTCIKTDITKESDLKKAFLKIKRKFGKIELIINNAGIHKNKKFSKLDLNDWKKTFEVNLFGTVNVIKTFLPIIKEGIINVSSIRGVKGSKHNPDYSASKAAIINLTQSLAKDLKIRVNCISPGLTKTSMIAHQVIKNIQTVDKIPMHRPAEPREIAEAIFNISQITYLTGENVIVDGGYSC